MTRRIVAALAVVLTVAVALAQNPIQRAAEATKDAPEKKTQTEPEQKPRLEVRLSSPTPQPDRIILTWKGDPATTQAVTWRTDTSVTGAVAQIALADPGPGVEPGWRGYDPKKVTTAPARTDPLKTAINEAHYHSVNFEGLRPKTRYMYRVGDGTVWSEWFQFDTASTEPEPFGFIYFGDAQNGIKTLWSRVARGAYSDMPKAKFIVHAGDLVDRGTSDIEWGEWHTAAGWINGMVPSLPTPGNHEYTGSKGLTAHWRAQFTLPENGPPGLEETCYSLDFQGVRMISLNTEEKVPEQAAWLEGVLANRPPAIRWTVVTLHRPLYATAAGRQSEEQGKAVRVHWRPVFDRYTPDLVLQGHDHSYGRSGLMKEDNLLSGTQVHTERGTVYVVSVSGAKMYTVGEQHWMANTNKGEGMQLYQLIRIDGDTLKYESRTATGELFDAFTLRKRPDGGNDLIEGDVPLLKDQNNSRPYWNAAAGLVILTAVGLGVAWAFKGRNGTNVPAA
ncbi:MAG TPA: metallophosphoesterase family protein [Gemmataceae bacterium]|nr:metallophosphoesterase family protein [Gemmataceae bacterium]